MATVKTKTKALPKSKAKNAYELLDEVVELTTEEPLRMRMGVYRDSTDAVDYSQPIVGVPKWPACGTVGCIAGWIYTLRPQQRRGVASIGDMAGARLGLNQDQRLELFHNEELCQDDGQGTLTHARRVVRHIRRFQQSYEKQLKAKAV